jgi:hypothetical protein
MKRNDYDFSSCLFDPTKPKFLTSISEIPAFNLYNGKLPKGKVFAWIVMMYDLNSPMRRTITNYYDRKRMCAELAGWETGKNSEFAEDITKMLVGEDSEINGLITAYLALFSMPEYTQLIAYLNMQYALTMDALTERFDHTTAKTLDFVTEKIKILTNEVFGSGQTTEVMKARQALYNMAEKERIRLNPENIVKIITEEGELPKEFNPYGDYTPGKIVFAGDEQME